MVLAAHAVTDGIMAQIQRRVLYLLLCAIHTVGILGAMSDTALVFMWVTLLNSHWSLGLYCTLIGHRPV